MLIFNEIKCKILYSIQKKAIYTLSMALSTQVNYKKRSKYSKNALKYCVSNAIEI
jgi:hypothetical protein